VLLRLLSKGNYQKGGKPLFFYIYLTANFVSKITKPLALTVKFCYTLYGEIMKKIAKFYKVSETEYVKSGDSADYNDILLPKRATAGSAGYDFFAPFEFLLDAGETIKVPTGVRVQIDEGWVLKIYPRSSLGFKYRLTLNNTVGIIDSDYFFADNEGHIFIKMTNCGDQKIHVEKGKAFAQGVFVEYGITVDDDACELRTGGLGSTDKK
jgi:dUTP pyrophosphatase